MNLKYLIFIFFISCKSDSKGFRIDKFLDRKGIHTTSISNKILQTNIYNGKLNLVLKNEYSRTGCNLIDSTIFLYSSNNKLLDKKRYSSVEVFADCKSRLVLKDHILFRYNLDGKLIGRQVLKGVDPEILNKPRLNKNGISPDLKDSLSLLKDYFSDIQFVADNTMAANLKYKNVNNVKIYLFNIKAITSILLDYGIPSNEFLLQAKAYIEGNRLIKDEFKFENYIVTRVYVYKNNLLQKVVIENMQIDNKNKSISIESFVKSDL